MATVDPYTALGVSKSASQDEIKSAYRKLAKKWHPDLNPGNKKAEDEFKKISTAYDFIGEPEKRAKFDRGEFDEAPHQNPYQGGGARYSGFEGFGSGGAGFGGGDNAGFDDDFLQSLFGRSGGRRGRQAPRATRGEDRSYRLDVELREIVLGSDREIQLPNGKRLQVHIPAGFNDGATLRLKRMGEPGPEGTPAGDALVEIHVVNSGPFRREGQDLITTVDVPYPLAVAGGDLRVVTLDGAILLKIPARTRTGARLRVKDKGIRDEKSKARGVLYIEVRLSLPEQPDAELETAARSWVERHPALTKTPDETSS